MAVHLKSLSTGLGNDAYDLGIVFVKEIFQMTPYLRPICLWNESYDFNLIENTTGTV
jgi:hypothetical protein